MNRVLGKIFVASISIVAMHGRAYAAPIIRFGGDAHFPPYEFLDAEGGPAGFNVDLAREIGEVMNYEILYELGSWTTIRERHELGEIDVLNTYRSDLRETIYDLSPPHTVFHHVLATRKPGLKLDDLTSLQGYEVLVCRNTVAEDEVRSANTAKKIIPVDSEIRALQSLTAGTADIAVVTQSTARELINPANLGSLMISGNPVIPTEYCFTVMRDQNRKILLDLTQGLAILKATGRLDEIRMRWFPAKGPQKYKKYFFAGSIALAVLSAVAVTIIIWNLSLKKKVRQQAAQLNGKMDEINKMRLTLMEKHHLLRSIIDGTDDLICAKDFELRYTLVNRSMLSLVEKEEQDLLGKTEHEVFPPFIADTTSAAEHEVVKCKESRSVEFRLANNKVIMARISPLLDPQGVVGGIVGVGRDVTEAKEQAHLKDQILRKEADARQMAERLNVLKNSFLLTLSHELRTPMSVILGWTEMLRQDKNISNETRMGLEIIHRNANSEVRLISDLLDLSAIEAGRVRLDFSISNPASIVTGAVNSCQASARTKSIQLTATISDELPSIKCDEQRLRQVLDNLLTNAIKFTNSGGEIELVAKASSENVEISVRDNGSGIDPEFLDQIFDRFTQEDLTMNRKYHGLGIGLALCSELVKLHGGKIRAASEGKNKGAVFTVEIPIYGPPLSAHSQAPKQLAESPGKFKGVRVLAIDDFEDFREALALGLKQFDLDVTTCESADEFIRLCKTERPDILICDIGMPDIDGYSLLKKIRASPEGSNIPAIALSAYAGKDDVELAIQAGFQKHLSKPATPMQIAQAIDELLSSNHK